MVREQIKKARTLTDKPFGVNVMLMSPFSDEVMEVVIEEKPAVVATGAGNPGKYIERLKEAGIKIMPVIASVAMAKRMEKAGADAVIAEGTEAGGHIGELTTMVLTPQVVDAVSIPADMQTAEVLRQRLLWAQTVYRLGLDLFVQLNVLHMKITKMLF